MGHTLKALIIIATISAVGPATAGEKKAGKEEAAKVVAVIKEIGCDADLADIEVEKSGDYEIDDASCKIGQYDIKVSKQFKIISINAD